MQRSLQNYYWQAYFFTTLDISNIFFRIGLGCFGILTHSFILWEAEEAVVHPSLFLGAKQPLHNYYIRSWLRLWSKHCFKIEISISGNNLLFHLFWYALYLYTYVLREEIIKNYIYICLEKKKALYLYLSWKKKELYLYERGMLTKYDVAPCFRNTGRT